MIKTLLMDEITNEKSLLDPFLNLVQESLSKVSQKLQDLPGLSGVSRDEFTMCQLRICNKLDGQDGQQVDDKVTAKTAMKVEYNCKQINLLVVFSILY